jgi:glycosyltransferase involved in cell wall biosynthesis
MADDQLAVVIPVYNRARVIRDALESVAAQTCPPARLIVVDDGSTDGTANCVEAWRWPTANPPQITLIRQANRGAAAARNVALEGIGDTPLVAFLDSDDVWPADFLARTIPLLRKSSNAVAASVDREIHNVSTGAVVRESFAPLAIDSTRWFFEHHGGVASASLFRTEIVRRCGGFPADLPTGHDVILFSRIGRCGPWLHDAGLPVVARHGLASSRGGADHVCQQFADYHRRWAYIWESLASENADRLPQDLIRRVLSFRWSRAGRQLSRAGRWHEAQDCFRRANGHRWTAKATFHSWLCRLRSQSRDQWSRFTRRPRRQLLHE